MTTTTIPASSSCPFCNGDHSAPGLIGCAGSLSSRLGAIAAETSREIDYSDLAGEIDLSTLAREIDLDALAGTFDASELVEQVANAISTSDLAREVNLADLASEIDTTSLASEVAEACGFDASDVAGAMDAEEVASNLDLDDVARALDVEEIVARLDADTETAKMTRENDAEITRLRERVEKLEETVGTYGKWIERLVAAVGIQGSPEACGDMIPAPPAEEPGLPADDARPCPARDAKGTPCAMHVDHVGPCNFTDRTE